MYFNLYAAEASLSYTRIQRTKVRLSQCEYRDISVVTQHRAINIVHTCFPCSSTQYYMYIIYAIKQWRENNYKSFRYRIQRWPKLLKRETTPRFCTIELNDIQHYTIDQL